MNWTDERKSTQARFASDSCEKDSSQNCMRADTLLAADRGQHRLTGTVRLECLMNRRHRQILLSTLNRSLSILSLKKLCLALLISIFGYLIQTERNTTQAQETSFATPDPSLPISVSSQRVVHWAMGDYEVLHLRGAVQVTQGHFQGIANEAILWIERPELAESGISQVVVYLEGQTVIDLQRADRGSDPTENRVGQGRAGDWPEKGTARIVDEHWLGHLMTSQSVDLDRATESLEQQPKPEIFQRAQRHWQHGNRGSVIPVAWQQPGQPAMISPFTGQLQTPQNESQLPMIVPQDVQPVPPPGFGQPLASSGGRTRSPMRIQIAGRDGSIMPSFKLFTNPQNANEQIGLGVGGFRIVIESLEIDQMALFQGDKSRQVVLVADNIVQWQVSFPDGSQARQFYLEGNVVFVKDRRTILAERMFYDVEAQRGTILDAEILTPVPSYKGLVRMKADIVQQVDANSLQAYGAALTSSRMGVPRYWLQSGNVSLTRAPRTALDPQTDLPMFDPDSGNFETEDEYFVESRQNRVYLGGVPVLAWPRFRTSLDRSNLYLERIAIGNDRIFGTQVRTGWDLNQVLGRSTPEGSSWIGVLDYLSNRGLGYGTETRYRNDGMFGFAGPVEGDFRSWYIRDSGSDFLGRGRFNLLPETKSRGKLIGYHRHQFESGWQLKAEAGYISDRNFLEQFYLRDWDRNKDATTGAWLERNEGTQSWNVLADYQINDFFTQTSWLPRLDHFVLGQSLLGDRVVWRSHTHAGYSRMRVATTPVNVVEQAVFDPLAWEANVDGVRAGTRHALDFPIQFGPMKVVPYLLGDLSYWQEDLNGNDLVRAYGQVGVRGSLPVWKVNPAIQSLLFNVNGLAHKVNFDFEAFYADASQDLDQLPLLDPLDDDAQEHFRRRFAFNTFGILPGEDVPLRYDERFFALRSGMQRYVTAGSMEIADDLALVRTGVRQRWQTKRGLPGQERIIDWITLDAYTTFFPKSNRDNFGSSFGMFDYDFAWQVGDRFALVSDGFLEFFSQGLRTTSVGIRYGRPEIGTLNLKYRMIEGPISANVVSAFANYRLSEKWGANVGGQLDFGEAGTIGQFLDLVYIGESFLWQIGTNYDFARENVSFRFALEPRFLPGARIYRPGGANLPPASSRFLE